MDPETFFCLRCHALYAFLEVLCSVMVTQSLLHFSFQLELLSLECPFQRPEFFKIVTMLDQHFASI